MKKLKSIDHEKFTAKIIDFSQYFLKCFSNWIISFIEYKLKPMFKGKSVLIFDGTERIQMNDMENLIKTLMKQ